MKPWRMRLRQLLNTVRSKPRVTLDTNVLVSATIADKGFAAQILRAFGERKIQLILSSYILAEYADVIRRPHIAKKRKNSAAKAEAILRGLNARAKMVEPQKIERVVRDDPKDDAILACAKEGNAQYIVTGDEHLLKLRAYRGIKILTPREFVEQVLQTK